jgi:hypothetical protein
MLDPIQREAGNISQWLGASGRTSERVMDPIESGFRRRGNFWVGVIVLVVLCAAGAVILAAFLG